MAQKIYTLLVLAFTLSFCNAQTFSNPQGQGSEADPYKITNIEELYWIAMNVNYWSNSMEGKYFAQQNDIDASATAGASYHNGQGWEPIGQENGNRFKGNYDGQGYSISGLYINNSSLESAGLFGTTQSGIIENVHITNANIQAENYAGAIAGHSRSIVTECSAQGTISGNMYVGGITGFSDSVISKSFSICTIIATEHAGCLVGVNNDSIKLCYTKGSVSGMDYLGGFVGRNYSKIIDCYSQTPTASSYVSSTCGGFVGDNSGQIKRCYSTGQLNLSPGVIPAKDGFCGHSSFGSYSGNFLDTTATKHDMSSGYYSLLCSTQMMYDAKYYYKEKWDIKGTGPEGIWNIKMGQSYPYFDWEFPSDPAPVFTSEPAVANLSFSYRGGGNVDVSANITDIGHPDAIDHGICWATTSEPTVADNSMSNGAVSAVGKYSMLIENLDLDQTYYFRAYITSSMGTFYSTEKSVKTYPIPQGSGTEDDPYLISTLGELNWISIRSDKFYNEFNGVYFVQVADIDAGDTKNWNSGKGWKPIGDRSYPFSGYYYGKGHTISNLFINRPAEDYIGLFGNSGPKLIDSLHVVDADITGDQYVGSIAGKTNGTIRYCTASGTVTGTSDIGGVYGSGDCSYVAFTGTVSGISNVGGVTGYGTVSYSCANANVSGQENVGGLAGILYKFSNSSYSTSSVTRTGGTAKSFGPLAGLYEYYYYYSFDKIHDTYATGTVTYQNGTDPVDKGLIGTAAPNISDSELSEYAAESSMWDYQTSGQTSDLVCINPRSTAEMTEINTFINYGWGFKDISAEGTWNIGNGRNDGYPYLSWMYPNDPVDASNTGPRVSAPSLVSINADHSLDLTFSVTSLGIPRLTDQGLCWSTDSSATIADNARSFGTIGSFDEVSASISGLDPQTTYYIRAYATSSLGTFYGQELTVIPSEEPQGDGSETNPYQVSSVADLYWMQYQANKLKNSLVGIYFEQQNDIDISETRKWNNGAGWTPIGIDGLVLNLRYEGNGYTIDGLYINRPKEDHIGLFGFIQGVAFKATAVYDLGITNADITGGERVGILAAFLSYSETSRCYTSGKVSGKSDVGGLAGYSNYGSINWCYSTANVYAKNRAGGFIGVCDQTNTREIHDCYSRGTVTRTEGTDTTLGGFTGIVGAIKDEMYNLYSTGTVEYADATNPTDNGFCGGVYSRQNIYDCLWDTESSGQQSDGITNGNTTGLTTAEMQTQLVLESYNFSFDKTKNVYWILDPDKNDGYPYFSWQKFPETPVIKTNAISSVTINSATLNGEITDLGATNPTAHGFCWGETENPTIASATAEDLGAASATGTFSKSVALTDTCATYYVRAFATNTEGTAYGSQEILSLDSTKPVITWDNPSYIIYADPLTSKGTIPDFATLVAVDDNCGEQDLDIIQSISAGTGFDGGTSFQVQVTATDKAGNKSAITISGEVLKPAAPEQEIILAEGWSLVSLYLQPADASVEAVFPDADRVKTLEQFCRKGAPSYLNSLTEIEAGKGYLVKNQKADTLTISGSEISGSVALKDGWNLTGVPSGKAIQLDQLPADVIIKNFEVFYINGNPASEITELEPGKAYFIKK